MTTKQAVVIGGGFAGLAAGYELRKAGWAVTLIEAADEVGGRVRTVRRDGYTFDTGATQMSTGYREYLALCRELGLREQMVESSPYIGLLRDGQIHRIDGRSMLSSALTPALSWRSKFRLLNTVLDWRAIHPPLDVFDVSRSHVIDVESAKDYALRRLNREIYETLVDPLIRCYVMNNAEATSALEWFSTLANLGSQTMLSYSGGNDRLPKALASHLNVRLNSPAQALEKTESGVRVHYHDAARGETTLDADVCVLATRVPETLQIYPEARPLFGSFGEKLRYNRAWVVQLGYRRKPDTDVIGVLLPTRESPDVSLLWLEHNKNPDRAPNGHALFSVYSDEAANDRCYPLDDEQLIALAKRFVETRFPEVKAQHEISHVTRWPAAIPQAAPGIYKAVHEMKLRLDPRDRVQLAGDYLTCVGQNSAIYCGRRAARNLLQHHG